jgi:hypothetical protein
MKYTKEQLDLMSDHTLNHALYTSLYYTSNHELPDFCPEYCSNWSAIMPPAFEHDVVYLRNYKSAYSKINGHRHEYMFTHEKPQRAIACCLILVLQERQQ